MSKNIWVFCEQRDGVILSTGYQLLSEGRKLANDLGVELCGVLLGGDVAALAGQLGGYATDVMGDELAHGGLTKGAGFDSPLFGCENFIVSPHIGAQTQDAAYLIGQDIIAKVKAALDLK